MEIKDIAKKLGLKDDASEDEIVAQIEKDQKETEDLKATNKTLVETNNTLASSEKAHKERIDELEKNYRELSESKAQDEKKAPKSDIEKLIDLK